jgi:hypothetical protein
MPAPRIMREATEVASADVAGLREWLVSHLKRRVAIPVPCFASEQSSSMQSCFGTVMLLF